MRSYILKQVLVLAVTGWMLASTASLAGPTCENRDGAAVRCGTPGAMPQGWEVSPQQRTAYINSLPPDPSPVVALSLAGLIGALFALIALMPDFDGRSDSDWGRQEGDEQ